MPVWLGTSGLCARAAFLSWCCHVCPAHSHFCHLSQACRPRLAFPVGTGHGPEVRAGMGAARGKGYVKAWTHRGSGGAGGAVFSSEAWEPLKKPLLGPRGPLTSPESPRGQGGPIKPSPCVETPSTGRSHTGPLRQRPPRAQMPCWETPTKPLSREGQKKATPGPPRTVGPTSLGCRDTEPPSALTGAHTHISPWVPGFACDALRRESQLGSLPRSASGDWENADHHHGLGQAGVPWGREGAWPGHDHCLTCSPGGPGAPGFPSSALRPSRPGEPRSPWGKTA